MIDVLKSVFIFFDSSPKRERFLETSVENDESVDFSRKKHVDRIKEIRREVEPEFNSCFEDAKQIAEDLDIVVKTPAPAREFRTRGLIIIYHGFD